LQEYDYKVVHRPGVKSANCDGLTRQPLPAEGSYDVEPFEPLPTNQVVVSVLTRAQREKAASSVFLRDALDEHPVEQTPERKDEPMEPVPVEEKHDSPPVTSPENPGDTELFRNPFRPRRSNIRPFFDCEEDKEGGTRQPGFQNNNLVSLS
jgi:hypothetical protein